MTLFEAGVRVILDLKKEALMVSKNDNYRWHLKRLHDATTDQELIAATLDIDYDKWEGMEWTKDSVKMSNMRHRWRISKERIDRG